MTDPTLAGIWIGVLGAGLLAVVALKGLGLPRTYARDLLHVGAGVWVLGWPGWRGVAWPVAIPVAALVGVLLLPWVARRLGPARAFLESVSGGDEGWTGIVLYVVAFAAATAAGRVLGEVPAATALLALCLGDGIGGLVGRVAGRHRFRVPWAKEKSLEGSVTVALLAAAGAVLAALWFGQPVDPLRALAVGGVAAVAEAVAPRASDNLLVPAVVWGLLLVWR